MEQEINCKICNDFHFVNPLKNGVVNYSRVIPCSCVKEKAQRDKVKRLLDWCELPPASEEMTFDLFILTNGLRKAYEASVLVAKGNLKWLTLMSSVNRGKTHLAVAICRKWLERGIPARYAYVPLLMDELRRGYNQGGDGSYDVRFEMFLNTPLLVLDDLGTENSTPWVQEKLDTIIDYRLMHDLSLVVTTNLSPDQLSPRIASRLKRAGEIVAIDALEYKRKK